MKKTLLGAIIFAYLNFAVFPASAQGPDSTPDTTPLNPVFSGLNIKSDSGEIPETKVESHILSGSNFNLSDFLDPLPADLSGYLFIGGTLAGQIIKTVDIWFHKNLYIDQNFRIAGILDINGSIDNHLGSGVKVTDSDGLIINTGELTGKKVVDFNMYTGPIYVNTGPFKILSGSLYDSFLGLDEKGIIDSGIFKTLTFNNKPGSGDLIADSFDSVNIFGTVDVLNDLKISGVINDIAGSIMLDVPLVSNSDKGFKLKNSDGAVQLELNHGELNSYNLTEPLSLFGTSLGFHSFTDPSYLSGIYGEYYSGVNLNNVHLIGNFITPIIGSIYLGQTTSWVSPGHGFPVEKTTTYTYSNSINIDGSMNVTSGNLSLFSLLGIRRSIISTAINIMISAQAEVNMINPEIIGNLQNRGGIVTFENLNISGNTDVAETFSAPRIGGVSDKILDVYSIVDMNSSERTNIKPNDVLTDYTGESNLCPGGNIFVIECPAGSIPLQCGYYLDINEEMTDHMIYETNVIRNYCYVCADAERLQFSTTCFDPSNNTVWDFEPEYLYPDKY